MAVIDFLPQADPELGRTLRDLPEFDPPAALWQRIAAAAPPRRPMFWPYAAAATIAVLAAFLWLGTAERRGTALTSAAPTAPAPTALATALSGPPQAILRRQLDALDRSLQEALDRQAPAADVAALIGERQRIAAALAQATRPDATILTL